MKILSWLSALVQLTVAFHKRFLVTLSINRWYIFRSKKYKLNVSPEDIAWMSNNGRCFTWYTFQICKQHASIVRCELGHDYMSTEHGLYGEYSELAQLVSSIQKIYMVRKHLKNGRPSFTKHSIWIIWKIDFYALLKERIPYVNACASEPNVNRM